jgi:hypothetical protein
MHFKQLVLTIKENQGPSPPPPIGSERKVSLGAYILENIKYLHRYGMDYSSMNVQCICCCAVLAPLLKFEAFIRKVPILAISSGTVVH